MPDAEQPDTALPDRPPPDAGPPPARRAWLALVVLAMVAVAAVRARNLDVPLERDEGEYAYAGSLLLDGVVPWKEAANMKLPGVYAAYAAVLAVLGDTPRDIHLGLLVVNLATMAGMFLLGRALVDDAVGALAATIFGTLAVARSVQGLFANAEHFVLLFALPGLALALRRDARTRHRVAAGLLLGVAVLMKQHGVFLAVAGGLAVLAGARGRAAAPAARAGALFAAAVVTPALLTAAALAFAGVFDRFWFWTVDYARAYADRVPLELGGRLLRAQTGAVAASAGALLPVAALGLASPLWFPPARVRAGLLYAFTILSVSSVFPGLLFRAHYFVLTLPAIALLAALGVRAVTAGLRGRAATGLAVLLVVGGCAATWWREREYLFVLSPIEVSRATYGTNPFPESVAMAALVRESTAPDDTIAVIGSEPQIYVYARRRAATSYLYAYPLVEAQPYNRRMQLEFIAEVEANEPRALVYAKVPTSWLSDPSAPDDLDRWLARYTTRFRLAHAVPVAAGEPHVAGADDAARLLANGVPGLYLFLRR